MKLGNITEHPIWPKLAPYLEVQLYMRDGGPIKPRFRLNVKGTIPPGLLTEALNITVSCADRRCGKPIHPIRTSNGWASYYAAACDSWDSHSCSRSKDAHANYEMVRAAIEKVGCRPRAVQLSFLEELA